MRSGRFPTRTLVKVVAFTVLSAAFTLALAIKIGNLQPFAHTYPLQAVFTNASGVFKGDAVKLAGVNVGRVNGARIENGKAVVQFTVNRSVALPRDSMAAIRWRNVLGQRFLYLYPGRPGGPQLHPGDTIPVGQSVDAGDLDEFLNKLGPILRAIDPAKANAFLEAMDTALNGKEATVRELLDDGSGLAQRLAQMDTQIQTLISSSDTVLSTYAAQDRSIGAILDDLDSLGGRLGQMTGDINSVLVNFADVQQQLDKLLTQNRGNIDADLSQLQSVTQLLARNRASLATTLCSLPAGLTNYFQTTSWGEWFNVRIVQVVVKDQSSNPIGSVNELPGEHGKTPPAYSCGVRPGGVNPPGTKGSVGAGESGRQAPQAPALPGPSSGFGNLRSFLQFVLQGGSRG